MIINHTHKFIFVHIPKAAGTAVTSVLSTLSTYRDLEVGGTPLGEAAQTFYARRFGLRKHSRAEEILAVMGEDVFSGYFRFAFVRNPYERLASAFHFLRSWQGLGPDYRKKLEACPDFESFLDTDLWTSQTPGRGPDAIFQPQVRWLFSAGGSPECLVDFVGKTENLEQDMRTILGRIGAPEPQNQLPHANRSPEYSLPAVWKPEVIKRIQREYMTDFDTFGYSLEPPGT